MNDLWRSIIYHVSYMYVYIYIYPYIPVYPWWFPSFSLNDDPTFPWRSHGDPRWWRTCCAGSIPGRWPSNPWRRCRQNSFCTVVNFTCWWFMIILLLVFMMCYTWIYKFIHVYTYLNPNLNLSIMSCLFIYLDLFGCLLKFILGYANSTVTSQSGVFWESSLQRLNASMMTMQHGFRAHEKLSLLNSLWLYCQL